MSPLYWTIAIISTLGCVLFASGLMASRYSAPEKEFQYNEYRRKYEAVHRTIAPHRMDEYENIINQLEQLPSDATAEAWDYNTSPKEIHDLIDTNFELETPLTPLTSKAQLRYMKIGAVLAIPAIIAFILTSPKEYIYIVVPTIWGIMSGSVFGVSLIQITKQ